MSTQKNQSLEALVEKIASRPEVRERFPDEEDFVVSTMKKQAVRCLEQIMQGDGELRRKVLETELDVKTASAEELFKLGRWFAKQALLELEKGETAEEREGEEEEIELAEQESETKSEPAPASASASESASAPLPASAPASAPSPDASASPEPGSAPGSEPGSEGKPLEELVPPDVSMRITRLEQQLDSALKEIGRLTKENQKLEAENSSLRRKLREAEGGDEELAKLRAENEELKRTVEGLKGYISSLEKALEEARGKYDRLLDSYAVVKLTRILSLAKRKGRITPADLSKELGMRRGSVYRGLSMLIRLGFLKRDQRGVYSLAEDFNEEREEIKEEIVRRILSGEDGGSSGFNSNSNSNDSNDGGGHE